MASKGRKVSGNDADTFQGTGVTGLYDKHGTQSTSSFHVTIKKSIKNNDCRKMLRHTDNIERVK